MRTNPYSDVSLPMAFTSKRDLNDFLGALEQACSFDDVIFFPKHQVLVKSKGVVHSVGGRFLTGEDAQFICAILGGGANAPSDVLSGYQADPSHHFTYDDRVVYRYRVNMVAAQVEGESTIKITMRSITSDIPSLEHVSIDKDLFNFIIDGPGLVIVTGETGSGKSTTLAAVVAELLRNKWDDGFLLSEYSSPIEFTYSDIITQIINERGYCNACAFQTEVGTDLKDYKEAVRNALRSNPDGVYFGELREYETISAASIMASSGHLVFGTLHAKGVVNSVMRMVQEYNPEEQPARFIGILSTTKFILSQQLIADGKGSGGRVPIRETLRITDKAQRKFASMAGMEEAQAFFTQYFAENGMTFMQHAELLCKSGKITEDVFNKFKLREEGI